MVIQCELCPANAQSAAELCRHFTSHFTAGRCGHCHKQLILIDGQCYVLQLHNPMKRNQNILEDSYEQSFDIKIEIDEFGSEHFQSDILDTSTQTKEMKFTAESNACFNEYTVPSNAKETGGDEADQNIIHPFELIQCDEIKTDNEALSYVDSQTVHKKATPRLSSAITVKKCIAPKPISDDFRCQICNKCFDGRQELANHKKLHGINDKPKMVPLTEEECKQLPKKQIFTTRKGEKMLKEFKCNICNKYLTSEWILVRHLKVHKERTTENLTEEEKNSFPSERIFIKPSGEAYLRKCKCPNCEKYFLTKGAVKTHIKKTHKHPYNSRDLKQRPVVERHVTPDGLLKYKCEICNKFLLSRQTLSKHKRTMHKARIKHVEERVPLTEDERRSLPPEQVFIDSKGQRYLKKFSCDICDKYALTKYAILTHIRKYHQKKTVEKKGDRFICHICNKEMKTKYTLRAHVETHAPARQFICNYCGYGCRTTNQLNQHLNTHTGAKPIKCATCGKGFGNIGSLKVHERVHTGEKPFKCRKEGCDRAYAHLIDLKRHLYGTHGIYTKKFECKICSRIFPENKLLTKHMNSHP